MVKLDMYDYELRIAHGRLVYILIQVECETDPTITDIVSELVAHKNKAYIEGHYGTVSNIRIVVKEEDDGEIKTYVGMVFLEKDRRIING